MTPQQWIELVGALSPVLVAVVVGIFAMLKVSDGKKELIKSLIHSSYLVANEIKCKTATPVDDIVALALGKLDEGLKAHGMTLTPDIAQQARFAYTAISGGEKQMQEVMVKSALKTATPANPPMPLAGP